MIDPVQSFWYKVYDKLKLALLIEISSMVLKSVVCSIFYLSEASQAVLNRVSRSLNLRWVPQWIRILSAVLTFEAVHEIRFWDHSKETDF